MFERVQTLLCKGHWLWEAGPILWMKRSSAGSWVFCCTNRRVRSVLTVGARVSRGGPQNTPWASVDILLFELIKAGLWISHIPVPGQERGNNPWYLWLIWYDVSGHLPHTLASAPWSPFAAENHVTYFLRLRKVETASLAIRTDIINQVWEKDYRLETMISYTFLVTNTGECCQIFPRKLTPSLQVD